MRIITIGREFGSGGRELGKRLADALGYAYYDREILTAIAQKSNMDEGYVSKMMEQGLFNSIPITFGQTFHYSLHHTHFKTLGLLNVGKHFNISLDLRLYFFVIAVGGVISVPIGFLIAAFPYVRTYTVFYSHNVNKTKSLLVYNTFRSVYDRNLERVVIIRYTCSNKLYLSA